VRRAEICFDLGVVLPYILSQLPLLGDELRPILAPPMADSVHALITGIIFIDPVLTAHSRVVLPAELAQPVKAGGEPGADVGRLMQALHHGILDLCQPHVVRHVLTVVAQALSLKSQHLSTCHLPL
jgi:hypothetical protein